MTVDCLSHASIPTADSWAAAVALLYSTIIILQTAFKPDSLWDNQCHNGFWFESFTFLYVSQNKHALGRKGSPLSSSSLHLACYKQVWAACISPSFFLDKHVQEMSVVGLWFTLDWKHLLSEKPHSSFQTWHDCYTRRHLMLLCSLFVSFNDFAQMVFVSCSCYS